MKVFVRAKGGNLFVNIRWKTLLILFLATLILMLVVYEVSQKIILDDVAMSENKEAESNAQRFITNLDIKLQNINSTDYDWSQWDDTYQFIENNNTAYMNSNLPDQTLINLGLNLMLFINQSRQLVFGKALDLENQTAINLQEAEISQISSARATIVATDLIGNIIEYNRQMDEFTGYTRDDLIGKPAFSFMSNADSKRVMKLLEEVAENGSTAHLECCIRKKDGSTYPVELSVSSLQDAHGMPYGFVAIIRDLTEKKQLEKRLFQVERLAAIGELAGMVGHDLRNPLTSIKSAVYFLKKKGAALPEEQAKAMLEIIEKGIDHSDKIINDLLDYARDVHLELQVNSVRNVLIDALAMVRIPENVKVINTISGETTLRIDKNKIERVFINLVKNAIDAMPNGGTITLNSKQANGSVEITFADTGPGISEEIMPKIFTPLFTTKAQGMGFGLAICKRIVEAHGGTITVETDKGKGTAFKVSLQIEPKQITEDEKIWTNLPESLLPAKTKA